MLKSLVWFRRDLRVSDHHALSLATKKSDLVYGLFIFDHKILSFLASNDKRVSFIYESLLQMEESFKKHQSNLIIAFGDPTVIVPQMAKRLKANNVYFNRDFEPYAKKRDSIVSQKLEDQNIEVHSFIDHVFFGPAIILNAEGLPYRVFTPFKRKWYEHWSDQENTIPKYRVQLKKLAPLPRSFEEEILSKKNWMSVIGFEPTKNILLGGEKEAKKKIKKFLKLIKNYHIDRDFPFKEGTSQISPYLRFGNISIRELIRHAHEDQSEGARVWLSELIWREFYQMILFNFPHVAKASFKEKYDSIKWRGGKKEFEAWKRGLTGFPIIDAAMRCLNQTGEMPNRLRMVTASFLCKTLLVDWKKGENYFSKKLLDFDMAANNGGWQWCSSSGTDSQPYFRIFNPWSQSKKFDQDGIFIRKWCPELANFSNKLIHKPHEANMLEQVDAECLIGKQYPSPCVSYEENRIQASTMYKTAIDGA